MHKIALKHKDTYFFDSKRALATAKCNNKVFAPNKIVTGLQLCYYHGTELKQAPENCINVPVERIIKYFTKTNNRLPENLDTTSSKLDKEYYKKKYYSNMRKVDIIISKRIKETVKKIQNNRPNFKDKRLRIFAHACRETVLIKYIIKDIMFAAKELGYDIYIHEQKNNMEACNQLTYLKMLYHYNPHITININHFNNDFLNNHVFNFIWFQDFMPIMENNSKIYLRNRDYVSTLFSSLDILLNKKNVSCHRQSFCVNNKDFKIYNNIKREKKIVFIGSAQINTVHFDENSTKVIEYCTKNFEEGILFSQDKIKEISNTFKIDYHLLQTNIIPYIVRDLSVLWLCDISSEYKLEIYGKNWDLYEKVKPYYKGELSYGQDIAKIYNSATFSLCPSQNYILTQRVFESSSCGAIPIVYDFRDFSDEIDYSESFYFFKTFHDLSNILNEKNIKKVDFSRLLQENSYHNFVKKFKKIMLHDLNVSDLSENSDVKCTRD